MIRRILAVVGLVLFLGSFALLADWVFDLDRPEPAPGPAAEGPVAEPGP